MASILRQIVAGPRSRHPEAGLDLCYVTENMIATSGPSSTYPQRAYRNPTDALVKFLDYKHGSNWGIWEFRAEGTGYPDSEVYNRVHHFPWPDHHPPPFAIIPSLMASMRNWLKDEKEGKGRVVVVHCKAGKGRSGTAVCSYLMSEEGWTMEGALKRFTERRMRVGFGPGVSIPSQLRWVRYVDRWAREMEKKYMERKVEVVELHVWGLRDGVKVAVEGYINEGKKIKTFHVFKKTERIIVDDGSRKDRDNASEVFPITTSVEAATEPRNQLTDGPGGSDATITNPDSTDPGGPAVVFRPSTPIVIPTSDINIDFERRNNAAYTGWTMVTSVAHVWFNTYFEGGDQNSSGVFEIEWNAMDGIKGSARKGTRALDKLAVVWRYPDTGTSSRPPSPPTIITVPGEGEPVAEMKPADWRGADQDASPSDSSTHLGKELGLRTASTHEVSRASSVHDLSAKGKGEPRGEEEVGSELEGVRSHGPDGEDVVEMDEDEAGKAKKLGASGEGEGQWLEGSADGDEENTTQTERNVGTVGLGKAAAIVNHLSRGDKDQI